MDFKARHLRKSLRRDTCGQRANKATTSVGALLPAGGGGTPAVSTAGNSNRADQSHTAEAGAVSAPNAPLRPLLSLLGDRADVTHRERKTRALSPRGSLLLTAPPACPFETTPAFQNADCLEQTGFLSASPLCLCSLALVVRHLPVRPLRGSASTIRDEQKTPQALT